MSNKEEIFKNRLAQIYPKLHGSVLAAMASTRLDTFRVNTLKAIEQDVIERLKLAGWKIMKGPFANSYFVDETSRFLSCSEPFMQGEIYIQEFSSMLAVHVLNPQEHEKILDLCASPGSKTSQIVTLTSCKDEIIAVEKNKTRFFALKRNLDFQGATCVDCRLENAVFFPKKYPQYVNYFDKVLVDAPCSNEGGINLSDEDPFKYWNTKKIKELSKLQRGILHSGVEMLKTGGTLIYSTCTMSPEENELVLEWLIKKHPEIEIVPISVKIKEVVPGLTSWQDKALNPMLKNAVRVLPSKMFTGFFVAKIIKH